MTKGDENVAIVLIDIRHYAAKVTWALGTGVARTLRMREVVGSNPTASILFCHAQPNLTDVS
jgi:hypothetical protein